MRIGLREPVNIDADSLVLRVIPVLRSDHVKRNSQLSMATTLYLKENVDLHGTTVPEGIEKAGVLGACRRVFCSRARALELPEPLWVRYLPLSVLLSVVWQLSGLMWGTRRPVLTYAIENNDVDHVVFGTRVIPGWVRGSFKKLLGLTVWLTYSRVAYGGQVASRNYRTLPHLGSVESASFEPLPSRDAWEFVDADLGRLGHGAIFVGVLEPRKGVKQLLDAWELVEAEIAGEKLVIVGSGLLEPIVAEWCRASPTTRVFVGRLAHSETAALISRSVALVAPSVRYGRWREQVGLPITEALCLGKTVVTTDETSLAGWLRERGHFVVGGLARADELSAAIVEALSSPLQAEDVRASLPVLGGRIAADRWLNNENKATSRDGGGNEHRD